MDYSPFAPEVKQDPYPYYAELRADHPVYRIEPFDAYALSRHADVVDAVMRPEVFSSVGFNNITIEDRPTTMMIFSDPPDHTRLRNLVNRAFTPKMVADLEPRIRQVTDDLVGRVARSGKMDLIADLGMPLPVTIIADILGVDPEHKEDFKRWSDHIVLDFTGQIPEDARERVQEDMEAFRIYFEQAVSERRGRPRNDLIGALVRAEEERQALTADEVLAFIVLLLVAGNETTTNLIGNAIIALLDHPDELAKVRAEPSLIPNTVEEALRYDAPVQFLFRRTTRDVEVAGTQIPNGKMVMVIFGAANRDERKFPDPDRFDVSRDTQGHLAFGHGIHFCLGAPLARLEARIALEQILRRLPDLARAEERVEYIDSVFLRGPKRLPLTFTPTAVDMTETIPEAQR